MKETTFTGIWTQHKYGKPEAFDNWFRGFFINPIEPCPGGGFQDLRMYNSGLVSCKECGASVFWGGSYYEQDIEQLNQHRKWHDNR